MHGLKERPEPNQREGHMVNRCRSLAQASLGLVLAFSVRLSLKQMLRSCVLSAVLSLKCPDYRECLAEGQRLSRAHCQF